MSDMNPDQVPNEVNSRFLLVEEELRPRPPKADFLGEDWKWDHLRTQKLRKLAELHDYIVENEVIPIALGPHALTIAVDLERDCWSGVCLVPHSPYTEHFVRWSAKQLPHGCAVNLPISVSDSQAEYHENDDGHLDFEGLSTGTYLAILWSQSPRDDAIESHIALKTIFVAESTSTRFTEADLLSID